MPKGIPASGKRNCKPRSAVPFDERAYQRTYHPQWRANNLEHVRAEANRWRLESPEKRREIQRRYREAHKDEIAAASRARRARQKNNKVTAERIAWIMAAADGHCTYCDQPSDCLELDHVQPIVLGGKHVVKNLVPACRACNASKSDRHVEDWLFDKHGVPGLVRALVMLEHRQRFTEWPVKKRKPRRKKAT